MTEPRAVSLVTLGVQDLERSLAFYEALGFLNTSESRDTVKFLKTGNLVLSLFPRKELARDADVSDAPTGFSAVTLGMNFPEVAQVDAFHARAIAAGARELKHPQSVFWGGHSGYFADPDGHIWELAHNPFFPMDEHGRLDLPTGAQT